MSDVTINQAAIDQLTHAVEAKLQELEVAVNGILADRSGKTVDEVANELIAATREHGVEPNHTTLRDLAERAFAQ